MAKSLPVGLNFCVRH